MVTMFILNIILSNGVYRSWMCGHLHLLFLAPHLCESCALICPAAVQYPGKTQSVWDFLSISPGSDYDNPSPSQTRNRPSATMSGIWWACTHATPASTHLCWVNYNL